MGTWVYGCDVCQLVCPWQRFAKLTGVETFCAQGIDRVLPSLLDLIGLDERAFRRRFRGTPMLRTGRARMARNAAVALGNMADPRAVPVLTKALGDEDSLVRGHAAWALGQIGGEEAFHALRAALDRELDPSVREELAIALEEDR
jgi:epoxyqueuosine reductase